MIKKCNYLKETLNFDHVINYKMIISSKKEDVNVYFDNVGEKYNDDITRR